MKRTRVAGLRGIELSTRRVRLSIVTEVGPRIAGLFWSEGRSRSSNRNLLFWDEPQAHRRGSWFLRGGHRVWTTRPEADETEETYTADNHPCDVAVSARGIEVMGPEDPVSHLRKSLHIRALSDDTFEVEHRVKNVGDMLWSGGLWGVTCTAPAHQSTQYGIPLGDDSSWDVFSLVIPRRWGGGHRSRVNDPQVRFTDACLLLEPRGEECKRMVQAPFGIIGMTDFDKGVSFIKKAPYHPTGRYPLNTNLALYIAPGNFMVEMETMGPLETLKPGAELSHVEVWALRPPLHWERLGRGREWKRLLRSL